MELDWQNSQPNDDSKNIEAVDELGLAHELKHYRTKLD